MSLEIIEKNLKKIIENIDTTNFIYDFLLAFDYPKSTIKRLKSGSYNLSEKENELIWKKKIYYHKITHNNDVHDVIDELSNNEIIKKQKIRFLIVTDFKNFLAKDLKTNDSLDISIYKLNENSEFFLPLIGREKIHIEHENPADIKAADQMGKLYDNILKDNQDYDLNKFRGHLNLFFTRLLFLYYADDSEIFDKNQFLNTVSNFTNDDGGDLRIFFNKLFKILNTSTRSNELNHFEKFPYVNGNLFDGTIELPNFTKNTRKMIIEGASLDWHMINPDILGSMLQAVVSPEEREDDEMHYTSVPNILKVIGPLFLDDLKEKINSAENDEKKLKNILKFIYNLKIFDPACGSGNFLIISYKQLSLLEINIFEKLLEINPDDWRMSVSGISLNQFYGIEKSNYAVETSKLSLWLAEHQMNLLFKDVFGSIKPTLPLKETGKIICENSINVDWSDFCQIEKNTSYVYLVGNPPFKGSRKQNINQKKDIIKTLKHIKGYKRLDYVSLWFFKAKTYIEKNIKSSCSFVSTDSICQGEHVSLLWPELLKKLEIIFAVKTFKWSNNARDKAGVYCAIIGLANPNNKKKLLIDDKKFEWVKYISPYLTADKFVNVPSRQKPFIKNIPEMIYGNMPLDGGFLKLDINDYEEIVKESSNAKKFLRPLVGGNEFIKSLKRWCIWIDDKNLNEALEINKIRERIDKVKSFRNDAGDVAKTLVNKPHQFRYRHEAKKNFILVPRTTTSSRDYLPIGYFDKKFISLESAQIVYDPPLFLFSILSSKAHMIWSKSVGGKLGTGVRYSSNLCFNTFPLENIHNDQIQLMEQASYNILEEREKFSELPISKIYSSEMPSSLLKVHKLNDDLVNKILFNRENLTAENTISLLFQKYEMYGKKEKLELF
jgi:hypothetical protein